MTNPEVLSAIEQELVRIEGYVATLRNEVHALLASPVVEQGECQAAQSSPRIPVYLTAKGAVHPAGVWFAGDWAASRTRQAIRRSSSKRRSACGRRRPSSITSGSVARSRATRWRTPMPRATGASTRASRSD